MSRSWDWARRLLTFALIAAAVAFIGRTVVTNSRDLAEFDWRVRGWVLTASVAAHVAVLAWGVFIWSRVLHFFAVPDARFPALLRIWALSNAARYIPGVVWQFFAAARLAGSSGLPQVVTLTSMLVHILLSLISAAVVAAVALPLVALGFSPGLTWALRIGLPCAAILAVHPAWVNLCLRIVPRALHREVLTWRGRWVDGLGLLGLALVSWTLYGVAYFLFLLALAPLPASAFATATGVNALSFVAGIAVPTPGGLGIKESAMTVLLTPLFPVGVAAVVSIAARLWSVVGELGLIALALLLHRGRSPEPADLPAG